LIWLDAELVSSRTVQCRALFDSLPALPGPQQVDQVVELYRGRFALDFMYEDWASPMRETLHARFRSIVERAVVGEGDSGDTDRALRVAQRALSIDPDLDEVERSLLKLYRVTGAHAAAAEQYVHYAAMLREELGVEPPPFDDL
jgi:DNA-binding SARP family transcriptional activator